MATHSIRPKISILMIGILLAGAGCLLAKPSVPQGLETKPLYANNLCEYPLRILILHKDDASGYNPHAWFYVKGYGENLLADDAKALLKQVVGDDLYIYAETTASAGVPSLSWTGGDATTQWDGVTYRLMKVPLLVNEKGDLEFQLACAS